jgi:hypothetical protein
MAEILDSIARAYARRDLDRVRTGLIQASAKIGGTKGTRIADLLGCGESSGGNATTVTTLSPLPRAQTSSAWHLIKPGRKPWVPQSVANRLAEWSAELEHAEALVTAGERCLPLLLVGETRCGKTSAALKFAEETGRDVRRLNAAAVISSYMGESATRIKAALDEMAWMGGCVFVIDEVDAIATKRGGDSAQDKERGHIVGCLLTWLEELPPHVPLICTTNRMDAIDSAVAGRMTVVQWPTWEQLLWDEHAEFLAAHGAPTLNGCKVGSYAEAVALGRKTRVEAVIGKPAVVDTKQVGLPFGGVA